jgi:phage terminase large subunit-like protein
LRPNLAEGIAKTAVLLGFETSLGRGLMPWQHDWNALVTEMDPAGRMVYRQGVLEVMRQQGKTVDLLSLMVAYGLRRPGTQIAYAAQKRLDARKRLLDSWWPRIKRSKLGPPLIDVRRGSGSEALMFRNGSMLSLISGTETSGHGDSLDLAVIDEAWAHQDDHVEQAVRPALMTTAGQLLVVSAAGTEKSPYFKAKVDDGRVRALTGATDTACYVGYSFADDEDPADPATWWRRMPALGITVTEETVAADLELMGLPEFRRAYGCQWPDVANPGWAVITEDAWRALADGDSPMDPVSFAVEVAPGRTMAAIAAAGRGRDGRTHVEVIEYRPGTSWVPARMAELRRRHRPCAVVIDPSSQAGALIEDLAAAGVEVTAPFAARDAAQACGQFYDAVQAGQLAHRDQPVLSQAMRSAVTRLLSDAWAWDRRTPAEDISPLVAVTLAAWGYTKFGRSRVPPYNMLRSVG